MAPNQDEEELLRSVALRNAKSIHLARQRAEEELIRAKEALELKTRELAQSLAMMRATLESTTDGILVIDSGGKVTGSNEKFAQMWGISRDVIESGEHRRLLEVTSQQFKDPRQFLGRIDDICTSSPPESYDVLVLADGKVFERFSRIQFAEGRNVGRVWSFRDITYRKQAEEAQARLAAIVESSEDGIVSKALDGTILSWNAGAERLFGYAEKEAVGRTITLIIPPERLDEEHEIIARIMRGERVEHFETVRVRKGGSRIDVSLTISPVRDRAGRIVGASKVARDITDRKRAEDALREADRRKDEFLALLAHELRNPLAPIRNAVQILRAKGPPVPELQWARELIDRQVQQMSRLVDDLLDVSRISMGMILLRKERVELAAIINRAVEASRPMIEKWGHELTITIPPDPVYLEADLARLVQVLSNLLNNAVKYTNQGGHIWLTAERESDYVLIRVKDNGIGIPIDMLPRIFDMFTQVDRTLERSQSGLGIGLTLVQRLVEMHGGSVEPYSDGPGRGSEFVVRLPVAVEGKGHGKEGGVGSEKVAPAPKFRILVVDDNNDSADSLSILLRMMGNEVHTAYDGLEAVGAAATLHPDVALLDIGLPKLNGYEAARQIRELRGSDTVLIALTGWGQDEHLRRSKEAGFDHHIIKPVDFEALMKLLSSLRLSHP